MSPFTIIFKKSNKNVCYDPLGHHFWVPMWRLMAPRDSIRIMKQPKLKNKNP